MKMDRLDQLIVAAHAAGLLPPTATRPENDGKPWPLVVMIGLGAWLSAIPLFAFLAFTVGKSLLQGGGAYVFGALLTGSAVFIFRRATTSVFVEQMGLPILLAGGGLLCLGLLDDTRPQTAFLILAGVAGVIAVLVPRPWLRVLLGAVACSLITLSFIIRGHQEHDLLWIAAHATLLVWLVASGLRHSLLNGGAYAALATTMESAGAGWLIVTLFSLAAWSGATFILSTAFGLGAANTTAVGPMHYLESRHVVSAAAAACGALWLAKSWPAVRQVWALIVAIVLVGLSWLNPTLGATLLVLACCMAGGRWLLASVAGIAAAWIIGAFYYQLSLPLASKALVMLGAAAILGGIAWFASPEKSKTVRKAPRPAGTPRLGFAAIALSGVAVLVVVNTGIWQKEKLLAQSHSIFVELAPVDPRSIMQGDYMALAFRLPTPTDEHVPMSHIDDNRKAVARVDGRGVVTMSRLSAGEALAEGEFLIELTRRAGRWTIATDAWYFKEGEAGRWAKAKYAEFRVDDTGRAMLIGMRGPNLEAL